MRVKILGSAAGGGFPQWNCACANCRRVRQGTLQGVTRTQAQLALSSNSRDWYLLNASPDLARQIEASRELQPATRPRETPIAAIVLGGADLDQILGLILLRESQPLRVYAAPSIRKLVIEHNIVFGMLKDQVTWVEINPGEEFELSSVEGAPSGIRCLPFPVSSSFPHYARGEILSQLNACEAQLGFRIQAHASGRSFVYMPAAPAVDSFARQQVESCDVLLFDGTFWSDDELIRVQGGGRTALQMGHMPISGTDGSLRNLANVHRPRKIYIHVNNTNPILNEQSSEYHEVLDSGWEVARDGLEFEL